MGKGMAATKRGADEVAKHPIDYEKPMVMAEIGCNHMGQFDLAKQFLKTAMECGVDYAKFQKRCSKELLTPEQYAAPHPVPANAFGKTYGEHREFLEFSWQQHKELKAYCDEIGLGYSTSVWDVTSAKEIIQIKPDFIKIPSACNNHFEMLKILRDEYDGDIHCSTGMTTKEEIETIVSFFEETGAAKERLVIYNCTSGYPVPFEDICLLEINRLKSLYDHRVKKIGFSGHHLGIAADVAAYTLGAIWNERHFTLDRTWKGTDHAASLEPAGLAKLCRDLAAVHKALTYKGSDILPIETAQRKKLKYRKGAGQPDDD